LAFLLPLVGLAESTPSAVLDLRDRFWPAVWIGDPAAGPNEFGVFHFRKAFELSAQPATFRVHVSGDNRYRLFVNGVSVGRGPARGDPMHWRYDTYDLAPYLRRGHNVLAAEVWNAALSKPWAQMSVRTGFLLQGDSPAASVVNTDATWRVARDGGITPEPIDRETLQTFIVSGDGDRVDGRVHPWGWEQPEFNDRPWHTAVKVARAAPYGVSSDLEWWLVPNRLPPMEERLERPARVRRATGVAVNDDFLHGRAPLRLPAHTRATVLLDQEYETNAYPTLTVSGGRGAQLRVTYAEALVDSKGQKGNRNEIDGRRCVGKTDLFLPDGGNHRTFGTLWFRTYRYLELDITTADQPLAIEALAASTTAYPFTERGHFTSDDPQLARIWEVGWRTARLCAHETYFDCPYYEQLQYVGDTRIQALVSLYVGGDDRLVRNAIDQFDQSRIAEGLTQSRYPSASAQVINTFSLFWIDMVHDYWMHRDDPAFVQAKLPGARNVLEWFERHIDPNTGMLGALPYWTFVDWTDEWPWTESAYLGGVPPGAKEGGSAIVSLQLAMTLRHAAEMAAAFGDGALAARYRSLAESLNRATLLRCWDPHRELFADSPARTEFSQHVNILAVLSGAIEGDAARDVMRRVLRDRTLVQCTYYFRFYLIRALKQVGLGDDFLAQLQPWRDMLDRGLTTFAEKPDPTRSDCHAWSASPCYDLLATVCGVEPASPGFKTVRIAPHLGTLKHVSGVVPLSDSEIAVEYVHHDGHLDAEVSLPPGRTGELVWHGRTVPLHEGRQHLSIE
jgi:hypothetical protein